MRSAGQRLHVITIFALLAILLTVCYGYRVAPEASNVLDNFDEEHLASRIKRQLEDLEGDDYPTASNAEQEEEPSFWDRVVKVALKLFSRFVEWLNSN